MKMDCIGNKQKATTENLTVLWINTNDPSLPNQKKRINHDYEYSDNHTFSYQWERRTLNYKWYNIITNILTNNLITVKFLS